MSDLLVKLYALPDVKPRLEELGTGGIQVRRAMAYEKHRVSKWVHESFSEGWASECEAAFSMRPITCFLAVREGRILGFACYDCTSKNFFGPTGVFETERGKGIGAALLLACLHSMAAQGYAYAIIGGAGELAFYERICGAKEIPGSTPGIYPPKLVD